MTLMVLFNFWMPRCVEAKMWNTSNSNDTQVGHNFISEFCCYRRQFIQLERVLCQKKSRDLVEIGGKKEKVFMSNFVALCTEETIIHIELQH